MMSQGFGNEHSEAMPDENRRVNIDDENDAQHWASTFGCTRDQLRAAVEKVGDLVLAVEKELLTAR